MEIGQKILDTIYKHNKSAYGTSSECIEVVYDDDYDGLTDDLVKLFSLHIVSQQRELLNQYNEFINTQYSYNDLSENDTIDFFEWFNCG